MLKPKKPNPFTNFPKNPHSQKTQNRVLRNQSNAMKKPHSKKMLIRKSLPKLWLKTQKPQQNPLPISPHLMPELKNRQRFQTLGGFFHTEEF